jgi:ABC-type taurine transport system substrate-binding protein
MTKQKKLFNKKGDSVEIKEDGKDVTVTVQYTTKVEPTVSATEDNFNDLVSVYERTGFTEEPRR